MSSALPRHRCSHRAGIVFGAVALLLASSCGRSTSPSATTSQRSSGRALTIGPSGASTSTTALAPSGTAAGATTTTSPGTVPVDSGPGAATGAEQALQAYLSALSHQDVNTLLAVSDKGPEALAGVLVDVADIDHARGATTTVDVTADTFSPAGEPSPGSVVLSGSATLHTSVTGPKGSGSSTDTISGPVTVALEQGRWKVVDFTYDGRPVVLSPTENVGQTLHGLTVQLGYVVSYGDLSVALVTLASSGGDVQVSYQSASLAWGGQSEQGAADFTGSSTPTGILRFARTASAPTGLEVAFTGSSGQALDFSFSLS
ncbi:MAG TPA: hypothetical protein VE991_12815 [Acidimicrobiales bacterium]|nr:hypothetical protein [Acidimicrobiales bacterium]